VRRPRRSTITMSAADYLKLAAGRLNVMDATIRAALKVGGNTGYALKFAEIFSRLGCARAARRSSTPSAPQPVFPRYRLLRAASAYAPTRWANCAGPRRLRAR